MQYGCILDLNDTDLILDEQIKVNWFSNNNLGASRQVEVCIIIHDSSLIRHQHSSRTCCSFKMFVHF